MDAPKEDQERISIVKSNEWDWENMTAVKKHFSLIELLTVIFIAGILATLAVPSFEKMMMGSKVNQAASQLKLACEQARVEAASSRQYVALIFPVSIGTAWSAEARNCLENFFFRGYRMAYVDKNGVFQGWVPGSSWQQLPAGTVLAYWNNAKPADNDATVLNYTYLNSLPKSGAAVSAANYPSHLSTVSDITLTKPDGTNLNGVSCSSAIVFNPYGGASTNLTMAVAEAQPVKASGGADALLYKTVNSNSSPSNYVLLYLNQFTGSVDYL